MVLKNHWQKLVERPVKTVGKFWQKKSSHRNAQVRVWHESSRRNLQNSLSARWEPNETGYRVGLCRPQRKTEDGEMCKGGIKKAQIMRAVTRDDVRTSSRKRIPKWSRSIFVFDYREPKLLVSSVRVIVLLTIIPSLARARPGTSRTVLTWNKNKSLLIRGII